MENACQGYVRCGAAMEIDKHTLFECHEARQVWKQFDSNQIKENDKYGSFKDWFAAKLETENKEGIECLSVIIWQSM